MIYKSGKSRIAILTSDLEKQKCQKQHIKGLKVVASGDEDLGEEGEALS